MFKEIFLFELKTWFKRPGIYLFFMLYFVSTFLLICAATGVFTGNAQDTNSHMNSAISIASILNSFNSDFLLGLITAIITVSIMGSCVQKDYQYNIHSLFYTKPLSKSSYLLGRFSAAYLLTLFALSGILLGLGLAFSISPNDNGQIGPFSILNYLVPFIVFTGINVFFVGVTFFSLVNFTRNLTTGYVTALIFIVIAGISKILTADIENKTLAALIDPFGSQALDILTEYWTPSEQNTRNVPLEGYVLYNRLLWLGISIVIFIASFKSFSFSQFLNAPSLFNRKQRQNDTNYIKPIQFLFQLPKAKQLFSFKTSLAQASFLTKFEFLKIVKSVFFIIIVSISVLLTVVTHNFSGLLYGTETFPVTYQMIDLGGGLFSFFLTIMIIFYSGIVVWRERDNRCDELIYSSPVKTWVLFVSKYVSLIGMVAAVYAVSIITSMAIQTYEGYLNYEFGLYLFDFYGRRILGALVVCALATILQIVVNNKFIGFTLTAVFTFGLQILYNSLDIKNGLLVFNSSGSILPYSDMNGYGHTLYVYYIYKAYWIGFMLVFIGLTLPLWPRLKEKNYKARLAYAKSQFNKATYSLIIVGLLIYICFGSIIYYNTRILNTYKTSHQQEVEMAEFEKKYKHLDKEFQPRIVESTLNIDMFPERRGATIKGYYFLKNKHSLPIHKIYLFLPSEVEIKKLNLETANSTFINDKESGFYGYKLNKPLQAGDSIRLSFDLSYFSKGFSEGAAFTDIVSNGSFFNSGVLPHIGYPEQAEISDNTIRKKYSLNPKPRMASINDTAAYANTYIAKDADWIRFEATVSTVPSQIAIAPGYLNKEWTQDGRRYFHYKMDKPILNFYAFLSAEYEVVKDKWVSPKNKDENVNIEIYFNKKHPYNVGRMINGIKKSLDYYTVNFSPYQHKQVRIIEFPRYASFAQSFPNTIPYSESIGFIAKVDSTDDESIDMPFYVTAHEVAHQWWAHQVIGADVQGSTLMSETMSQYSALMVMEKEYGKAAMKKFLKYEMDRYLQGRASENRKEVPIMHVENQQYIHYNKGSMVMYALKDYISEDSVSIAMQRYIKKVAFQDAPYTTALDFYAEIKKVTPDSLLETVKDLFERITVFNNQVKEVDVTHHENKYKVTMKLSASKTQSDSLGKAKKAKLNDWVDIGVFAKNAKDSKKLGKELYFSKHKITQENQEVILWVDEEPEIVGIDPYNKLIDLDPNDNLKTVKNHPKK